MPLYITLILSFILLVVAAMFIYLIFLDLDNRKKHKSYTSSKVKNRQYRK